GVNGVTLALSNLDVQLNTAKGESDNGSTTVPASPLDWTHDLNLNGDATFGDAGVAPAGDQLAPGNIPLGLTVGTVQASGTGTVNVFDFVTGAVSFVFKQQSTNVDADGDGVINPGFIPANPPARGPPDLANATLTTLGLAVVGTGISIGFESGPH